MITIFHQIFSATLAEDKNEFFAEQLYESMQGLVTQDRRLIRLIVTRSEIDLADIKSTFLKLYGQSLDIFIKVSKNQIS